MVLLQDWVIAELEDQAAGGFDSPLVPLQQGGSGGDGVWEDNAAVVHALNGGNDDGLHPVPDQVGEAGKGDMGDGIGIGQLLQFPGTPGIQQGAQAEGRFPAGMLGAPGGLQQFPGFRRGVQQGDGPGLPPGEIDGGGGGTAEREAPSCGRVPGGGLDFRQQAGKALLQLRRELVRQALEFRDVPAPAIADFPQEVA